VCCDGGNHLRPSTITILGYVQKLPLIILIDSGSTHSFVSPQVVKALRLSVVPCFIRMKVKVTNEEAMHTEHCCSDFLW